MNSAAFIAAVCLPTQIFYAPTSGINSGIHKLPQVGPISVGPRGLAGDHQGDTAHHGGIFKAVYAFARETREALARCENTDFADGVFGENLVTVGIDTDEVVIGSRWKIGTTVLEATCQRDPCRTFADWMHDSRWPRRFRDNGRCGAYFQVVTPGHLEAGNEIQVVHVPEHGVSIGAVFRGASAAQARALLEWAIDTETILYESQARSCLAILARAGEKLEFPDALRSTGRAEESTR